MFNIKLEEKLYKMSFKALPVKIVENLQDHQRESKAYWSLLKVFLE